MSSSAKGSTQGQSGWTPPTVEELQQYLPQYEIESMLGHGGMGAVYRGRQAALQRAVAIKVLPETLAAGDDELQYVERFKLEARSMANLDHPAIISVHDFGQTSAGHLYFVMEFIDGMDIEQYIAASGGQVDPDHAVAIVSHVLDALDYAHSKGILHRDIKPANVLINREGRVKIADFGLAKEFGGDAAELAGLTMTNMAMGTPDYIAPEALEMEVTPDHRADLYAVGVMLYRMLTGKLPRGMFKLPSEQNAEIDHRFDDIISTAMENDPAGRFQSATEFRNKLDELQSAPVTRMEPNQDTGSVSPAVSNRPAKPLGAETPQTETSRPEEKGKSKAGLIGGVFAGICVIGAVLLFPGGNPEEEVDSFPVSRTIEEPLTHPEEPESLEKVASLSSSGVSVKESPGTAEKTPEGALSPALKAPSLTGEENTPAPSTAEAMQSENLPPVDAIAPRDSKPLTQVPETATLTAPEFADIQPRLASYRDYRKKTIGALIVSYRKKLNGEKESAISSGSLRAVEELDNMLASLSSYSEELGAFLGRESIASLPLPETIEGLSVQNQNLLETFRTALVAAESDSAEKLDQSLNISQRALTQSGRLDDAREIRDFREKLTVLLNPSRTLYAAGKSATPDSKADEGWIPLMNGKDFSGWIGTDINEWSFESGAFISSNNESITFPFSHQEFELEGEWLVSKDGNGGVFFFNRGEPGYFELGLIGSGKEGKSDGNSGSLIQKKPGVPAEVLSPEQNFIADDTWTPFRLVANSSRINSFIDGREGVEFRIENKESGDKIGLQGGRKDGSKVGYRNFRIRPLKPSTPKPSVSGYGEWTTLTNGKDFTGWTGDLDNWRVEEGAFLTSVSDSVTFQFPHEEFEMEGEILISDKGNGGIGFLDKASRSFEFAIVGSGKSYWGGVHTGGIFYLNPGSPTERSSPKDNPIKDDTWTSFRVLVKDRQIVTWIDGDPEVEFDLKEKYTGETILLQGGRDAGSVVGYRNIRIRSL